MINLNEQIQIFNDDCLNILKEIQDFSIDLVFTDPPFFISKEVEIRRSRNSIKYKASKSISFNFGDWDNFENIEEYYKFSEKWFLECIRVLKKGGHLVSFVDFHKISFFIDLAKKNNCLPRQNLFWIKTNPVPGARKVCFQSAVETMIWITKETVSRKFSVFNYQLGQHPNYIMSPICMGQERQEGQHPTQKPKKVLYWVIKYLSEENQIVLDPFMGSGSVGVCCVELGRKFIGIEKDFKFFEIAKRRIYSSLPLFYEKNI